MSPCGRRLKSSHVRWTSSRRRCSCTHSRVKVSSGTAEVERIPETVLTKAETVKTFMIIRCKNQEKISHIRLRILEDVKNEIVYISGQTDQDLRAVCDLCLRQLWVLGEDELELRYMNPLFLRIPLIQACVRKLVTVPPVIICYPTVS